MNNLEEYFTNNSGRKIDKWMHYFNVYERHFRRWRNKEVVLLEVGVNQGGSLQMWKNYFGDNAKIYGIDIDPRCKDLEEENIKIFIGSQDDKNFLQDLKAKIPKIDILIDDGGHKMHQQITTFEALFDHIQDDGVYLCEDTHTSYRLLFGGGYKRRGTFIEYCKNFIDYLNAFHSQQGELKVNSFTRTAKSVHFYDSIVVVEKGKRNRPVHKQTGKKVFDRPVEKTRINRYKKSILIRINRFLAKLRLPGFFMR